jgi:UDP-N-acetylmuramate-alanine ligase
MSGLVTPVDPVPLGELGRVHFAGIGGAGMSGIARIMLARGVQVSGSDSAASPVLDALASLGAKVHVGPSAALSPPPGPTPPTAVARTSSRKPTRATARSSCTARTPP